MTTNITANWFDTKNKSLLEIAHRDTPLLMYGCGPTVYSTATLGNHRSICMYDLARRGLEWLAYEVRFVMNYTDVGHLTNDSDDGDDKLALQAQRERTTAWQIAEQTIASFERDLDALHIRRPTQTVRATDHISEMVDLITTLEERGYTYKTSDGIYFDTAKFVTYGDLAQLDIKGLQEGARVEKNPEKRNPTDFALWKFSPEGEKRDMEWESPWGTGFPGWHIECSAMAMATLGETIDLHVGGIDLLQPHHTNEVAQSEAATGKPFVSHWLHIEHLLINGGRMGKSEGNAYTIEDVTDKGFDALDFRYLILLTHYRKRLNFTWEALQAAATARRRLQPLLLAKTAVKPDETVLARWKARVADDLDLPGVLADMWEYIGSDASDDVKQATVQALNAALLDVAGAGQEVVVPDEVATLVTQREAARKNRDFGAADKLRQQIETAGYEVEDTASGSVIKPHHD